MAMIVKQPRMRPKIKAMVRLFFEVSSQKHMQCKLYSNVDARHSVKHIKIVHFIVVKGDIV